jgi:preprotein translocase subunit YajC
LGSLIIIVAMFALLWLLLIRPQRARQQQQQQMIDNVDVGDEVLSSGGIIGVVRGVDDDANELHVEIAPGIEVRMDRRAVGSIVTKDETEDEATEADEADEAEEREQPEETEEPAVLAEHEASVKPHDQGDGADATDADRRYPGTPA